MEGSLCQLGSTQIKVAEGNAKPDLRRAARMLAQCNFVPAECVLLKDCIGDPINIAEPEYTQALQMLNRMGSASGYAVLASLIID